MASSQRKSSISRTTGETDIRLELNVDGTGVSRIDTGVPFFDHMLTLFAKHGRFDLTVEAKGDIEIDLREIFGALQRRRWVLGGCVLLITTAVLLVALTNNSR